MTYLLLAGLVILHVPYAYSQQRKPAEEREISIQTGWGLSRPAHITPVSTQSPVGVDLRYSRLQTSQQSWTQCQCFFRSGFLVNAYTFRNPVVLGQSVGAGLFFEPIVLHTTRSEISIRALAGLTYVSRSYDAVNNPGNVAFGTPVNGLTGLGLHIRYSFAPNWRLVAAFDYKHISNAGVRLPNQGLNIPALSAGVQYHTRSITLPDPSSWQRTPVKKRWMFRALALGSMKVMPNTDQVAEKGYAIFGLNLMAGYRLTPTHTLSAGVEFLDDRFFREQIRHWTGRYQPYRQGTLLAGYEFWQGHFSFTAHMGWNAVRPLWYKPATYQKYGLLYRFTNGFTTGVVVKAYVDDTKNFQVVTGMTF